MPGNGGIQATVALVESGQFGLAEEQRLDETTIEWMHS